MEKELLYKQLAKYYDLVYSWKDYKKEALKIKSLIKKYKKSDGKELLDAACGTGEHLKYLKSNFYCTGMDISKEMLKIAKKNVKGAVFKQADIINFNINKKFDAILCLFSSIAYLKTYKNLEKSIKNFYKHLKNGGVIIIEGFIAKSDFKPNSSYMDIYDGKNVK